LHKGNNSTLVQGSISHKTKKSSFSKIKSDSCCAGSKETREEDGKRERRRREGERKSTKNKMFL